MPVNQTSGNLTTDAFGGGVAVVPNYIEDMFSTWLYTGNGSTQTITNGIDLSTKGGLVWTKSRNNATNHALIDTVRGAGHLLQSQSTASDTYTADTQLTVNGFTTTGYTLDADSGNWGVNFSSGYTYASWTFRKQPKFFDVVTYTGTGSNTTIAHSLGSVPGCIMVKRTDNSGAWQVYHSSLANTEYLVLNTTAAKATGATRWNSTTPTSTVFSVGTDATVNASGGTYVAYLFAHNAGGFGLTGTDNVISCGSFTTDGSGNASVNLGYEPQFVMYKIVNAIDGWYMYDTMRGWSETGLNYLFANTADAEGAIALTGNPPTATGFKTTSSLTSPNKTFIYIAIRRGPMKVPTDATKVFKPISVTPSSNQILTTGFPVDLSVNTLRSSGTVRNWMDRLRGGNTATSGGGTYNRLLSDSTSAENTGTGSGLGFDNNTGLVENWYTGSLEILWNFRRAPSFFDEVCYTGTSTSTTQAHNLGAIPELMIIKSRGTAGTNWSVYSQLTPTTYRYNTLQTNNAGTGGKTYGPGGSPNFEELSAQPTSTVINLASSAESNYSGRTFVAYLFATCAGVSKVGSYTGNGTTQTINCGFTGGARFVLIKRTDDVGDWYVYDTARGMTTLTDPYLLINSSTAETATLGSVTTVSTGFALNATILAAINTSSATYIFLAIA
jgi:hypothetical protein